MRKLTEVHVLPISDFRSKQEMNGLESLLNEIEEREISVEVCELINAEIGKLNQFLQKPSSEKKQLSALKNTKSEILKIIEKELKLVPKDYYRNMWMAAGMATFGLPLGLLISISTGNWAFIGIGLPIGMVIGMAYGTKLDEKAIKEDRQLKIDTHR